MTMGTRNGNECAIQGVDDAVKQQESKRNLEPHVLVGGELLDAEHQTSIVTHIEPDLSHHDFVGSLFCYFVEINLKEVLILTFRHKVRMIR